MWSLNYATVSTALPLVVPECLAEQAEGGRLPSSYCLRVQSVMVGTAWWQEASGCDCRNMKLLAYIWTDQEVEMGQEVGSDCEPHDPYSSATLPSTVPCLLKDPHSPQTTVATTKSSKIGFWGGAFYV